MSMSTPLACWLAEHRDTLLARWIALLEETPYATTGNGSENGAADAVPVAVHPGERRVLLTSVYDGLVSAADGHFALLDECLRLMRAFRSSPSDDELPAHLALIFPLRRLMWDQLFQIERDRALGEIHIPTEQFQLLSDLEQLLEHATVHMAIQWTIAAQVVARDLQETRQLVENLYRDTEAADRTTLQVSILNQISQGLSASLDQAQQLVTMGSALKSALGIETLTIWMFDLDTHSLSVARHWSDRDSDIPEEERDSALMAQRIDVDDADDLIARSFRCGDLIVEEQPDVLQGCAWYLAPCTVLAVPLIARHNTRGVIVLQHPTNVVLSDRSQHEFLISAASQAAISLENARLYEEVRGFNAVLEERIAERTRQLQVERDMLQTLYDIALEVSSTLDLDTLLNSSLNALANQIGVRTGSIMLIEPDTGHLVHRAVLGDKAAVGITRFSVGQGIAGWVAQNRKPALVDDVDRDPRWVSLPSDEVVRKREGSLIAVPLIAQYDTLGVLMLSHEEIGHFREEHLRLLNATAGEIALGINNALLYDQIEQQLLRQSDMLRRQEEEVSRSTAILQSLSDGVLVCNAEGAVITANPSAERILERPIEELLIWNLPELLGRLLGTRVREVPVNDLLSGATDAQNRSRSYSITFHIGMRVISATLDPVIASMDELMGAVAVFRDITREVESDRLKTEFIGTVSHELRTPMTSIKGFTQLLAMGSLGPINDTQKEFLNTIQSNAERMISIINDLLDITKIETGSVELELRELHLAETLSDVVTEIQPKAQERGHELSIKIPPGLPLVRADAKRFNQILFNLLSNAVKYTPRNGKISFMARDTTIDAVPLALQEGLRRNAHYVLIEIGDTGVGIAQPELERVFERFYRTENPLKVEAGGTGLGLSLVRPLIELFGGRIWVQSVLNEGSTFSFVLPAL